MIRLPTVLWAFGVALDVFKKDDKGDDEWKNGFVRFAAMFMTRLREIPTTE